MRSILKNESFRNAFFLYASQAANLMLPLIIFPHLSKMLGPNVFGRLLFLTTVGTWCSLFVEYGFNYSATREVISLTIKKLDVSELVSAVQISKLILLFVMFLVLIVVGKVILNFNVSITESFFIFLTIYSYGFTPFWYFQGIKLLHISSLVDFLLRVVGNLTIFFLISKPEDYTCALFLFISPVFISTTVLSIYILMREKVHFPKIESIKQCINDGRSLFLYRFASSLYTGVNPLILGTLSQPYQVASYAVAERVYLAANSIYTPVWRATFPSATKAFLVGETDGRKYLSKLLIGIMGLGVLAAVVLYLFSSIFGLNYFKPTGAESVAVLNILSVASIFIAMSGTLCFQWLIPAGLENLLLKITLISGLVNVLLCFSLIPLLGATGMAWSVLLVEILQSLALYYYYVLGEKNRSFVESAK